MKLFADWNKKRNQTSALPSDFDPEFYLTANPDVANAGIDPAKHYLKYGQQEGRRYKARSVKDAEYAGLLPEGFDPEFYLRANPDVADAGADPIEHYLKSGKAEKRSYRSRIPKDLDPKKASLLPVDFDPVFYAEANPDIVEVGLDPIDHYIQFGRNEGRHYRLGSFRIDYNRELDPQKKTVLVVGHEASRTGAPVLCLKIVEGLARDYNVIAYLMKGGALLPDFKKSANVTLELSQRTPADCAGALDALLGEVAVDYAIVNSAVSHSILPALAAQAIPSVSLLHEFTSYIYPRSIMLSILRWSTLNVFSSDIIRDDAMHRLPAWTASPTSHIVPQGRCIVDGNPGNEIIDRAFRPEGWPQDTRVIIGAGTFEFRKGVDLFLQTASQILNRSQNKNIRFVWFGKGYKPDGDMSFSVFIEEQIKRSGLQEHFEVIDEVGSLEYAYAQSDLLILSSRLDPLPNVGIDAICHGLPILCFSRASGIAEILEPSAVGPVLVSPYANTSDMADKALSLLNNPEGLKAVSASLAEIGAQNFSLHGYILQLEQLIEEAKRINDADQALIAAIEDGDQFDVDHWNEQAKSQSPETRGKAIRSFVREVRSGIRTKEPMVGYDIYDLALKQNKSVQEILSEFGAQQSPGQ